MPKKRPNKKRKHQASERKDEDPSTREPATKVRRKGDSLLDHIGFTTYASDLIYIFAALRRFVRANSKPTRRWFGLMPAIQFRKPELIFDEDKSGLSQVTTKSLKEFLQLNKHAMMINKSGTFSRRPAASNETQTHVMLEAAIKRLSKQRIDIVSFDDQFQYSELVYGIGVNHSFRRVVVVFRGSCFGNRDWPTNARFLPTSIHAFAKNFHSNYLSKTDLNQIGTEAKLHSGFASYLFGALSNKEDRGQHHSKFDKIASTLQELYSRNDIKGYTLVITGHSLGGALAQLLTFALGASRNCRAFLPQPIVGVSYASPCVGNGVFSKAVHKLEKDKIAQHIRITHQGDIVPVVFAPFGYTQTGCNLHVTKREIMKLAGFGNTETLRSQSQINLLDSKECHSMESYTEALYWKEQGSKVNGNSKVWMFDFDTVFDCVKEGKNILELPRPLFLWTVEELKQELRKHKRKVSGKKEVLIARLEKAILETSLPG